MLKRWKTLDSKVVCENPWWVYRLDEFEIPGGVRGQYHCVTTGGSSMVVPVAEDGRIVMVSEGRAYDPSGTRVVSRVTLQMEIEWRTAEAGTGDYQAQPNQDVSGGARKHQDTSGVDMSSSTQL